jgi:hypothetical protein
MKKFSFAIILTVIAAISFAFIPQLSKVQTLAASMKDTAPVTERTTAVSEDSTDNFSSLYSELGLQSKGLGKETFDLAVAGYKKLTAAGKIINNKLSIADFSQPSTSKRLYVIDVQNKKLLFNTLVAHGKNSGELMAKNFSNTAESNQSSLGFYVTAEKYQGKHGLSMKLDGVEKTNSNARERAIVMHAAEYVSEGFAKARGYIGRSWGCPAVSPELNEPIINAIGNGSCLFIYSPQADYMAQTTLATR